MFTANSNRFAFCACTWHIIIIDLVDRIGHVFMTVKKTYVGFIDSLTMVYDVNYVLLIFLYEDAIGVVLFNVFYTEFSFPMCDNEMVLTIIADDFKYFTAALDVGKYLLTRKTRRKKFWWYKNIKLITHMVMLFKTNRY